MTIPEHQKYMAMVDYKHYDRNLRRVAKRHNVSKSSLSRWLNAEGYCCKRRRRRRSLVDIERVLTRFVKKTPYVTLSDMAKHLESELGLKRGLSSVHRYCQQSKITHKRVSRVADVHTIPYSEYDELRELFGSGEDIISIDETCFYLNSLPNYGYAKRGCRARFRAHRHTMARCKVSLILAVSDKGVVAFKVLKGSCNSEVFAEFIQNMALANGTKLLMDNVGFHKTTSVKKVIERKHCTAVYTPPYSPWYNPVEYVFSKLKCALTRRGSSTLGDLSTNLEELLGSWSTESFTPCFHHVQKLLAMSPEEAQQVG